MEYKDLNSTPIEIIHAAFIDAFLEYEVKIDMPIAQLQDMLRTRSFSPNLSTGCFDNEQLVGFVLTGYRLINNQKICYDIATGVIKEYQNKKIGSQLIAEVLQMVKRNNIAQFRLEVLENNKAAQAIYQKSGFEISRKFKCFGLDIVGKEKSNDFDTISNIPDSFFHHLNIRESVSFNPSWQNSIESYFNSKNEHLTIGLLRNAQIIGHAIVHKENGSVLQFGLQPGFWNKNIEYFLINAIAQSVNTNHLRFINIEENSYADRTLESYGGKIEVNQFEMIYVNENLHRATACGLEL